MSDPLFSEAFLLKLERLALLARRTISGQLQGERRSTKRGQSIEFSDFRPYASGDDFRRIDWNAYARLERFFIKLFVEEEDLTVHFLIDTSQSMDWGEPNKLNYAIHAAGALGYITLVGLDRVTVTALGGSDSDQSAYFPPSRGKKNAIALFNFLQILLANSSRKDGDYLHARLNKYAANAHNPGPLILFSDLLGDFWFDGLNHLAGRGFEVTILHILSEDEIAPDFHGDYKLLDSETGQAVEITADVEVLERYHRTLDNWQDQWRQFCSRRRMHYIPITTSLPLEDLLFSWLPRQGVLK